MISFATQWRDTNMVVVIGAVALLGDYQSGPDVPIHVDDAANGTGLAEAAAATDVACLTYNMTTLPAADIIWVIDESGSMNEEQQSVRDNAANFFNYASTYGLDFRMGVVDVNDVNNGVFCTGQGQSGDTFLTAADLTAFQQCILEPWGAGQQEWGAEHGITQGYNAIVSHLPRASGMNDRIRLDAHLAIIYISDERCGNNADDDGDGLTDCADPECNGRSCGLCGLTCQGNQCVCPGGNTETACSDGLDNDCDGLEDCRDTDCSGVGQCETTEVTCDDGFDNDGDGDTDCDDADCPSTATESVCADGLDNDCDGFEDCRDPDCDGIGTCEYPEQTCNDNIDNDGDGDGLTDGQDLMDCGSAIHQEAFDACPPAWTLTGEWECGTPTNVGPPNCFSGTCIGVNLDAEYSNNQPWGSCSATSPAIDLTGTTNPTLFFQTWIDTEGSVWDGGNLKVSTDGGANWAIVTTVTPFYNLNNVDGQQAWGGHVWNTAWVLFQADLSAYIGQTVLLRFDFRADTNVTDPGWYVDEVVVID